MKIALDAKRAFNNQTGLGNYSRVLISGLENFYPESDYYLFTPKQTIPFAHKSEIVSPDGLWKIGHSLWRSYEAAKTVKEFKIGLYHGLSNEIPFDIHRYSRSIVTIHDLIYLLAPQDFKTFDRYLYHRKTQYAARYADHIIATSEQTKRDLIYHFGISEGRISVVYQTCHEHFMNQVGVPEQEGIRKKYNLHKPYLLFVGSLIGRKKPYELARAYQNIMNDISHDLVFIGKGALKKTISDLFYGEQKKRVHFIDPLATEMPGVYQAAELFIYPSALEGFGIPLVEAGYSKTPILTSNFSCLPEVAGPHAFTLDPDNEEEFSRNLQELLKAPEKLKSSAEETFKFVQKYTLRNFINQTYQLYQRVLEA